MAEDGEILSKILKFGPLIAFMSITLISTLLFVYAFFLLGCGITAVLLIGPKAKTALMSGGMSAVLSALTAYMMPSYPVASLVAGLVITGGLFCVFAWRSTKTLFKVAELISSTTDQKEVNAKVIAFMIISLMCFVSIVVFMVLAVFYIHGL